MDKLTMQTNNIAEENFKKLSEMFPNAVTETIDENGNVVRAIDKDVLMQEISTSVVEGRDERYQFTWPDKKKAILLANSPVNETLRPCREESVDFDNTENLYIEGDNLDVLKVLRETYLGKIKMIYIDPPYNTGNDFVYEDDFAENSEEYLANSGQYDENDNRLFPNTESNGRFHTDWLNMIYPRLKVAKDLLTDDGVIFISIDDNEVENLRKICDDIFGEKNKVLQISNLSNPRGRQTTRLPFALTHEYILVYSKNINKVTLFSLPYTDEQRKEYNLKDANGYYRLLGLRKRGTASDRKDRPNLFYSIYYSIDKDYLSTTKETEDMVEIIPVKEDGSDGVWRWMSKKVENDKELLQVKMVNGRNGIKRYDVFVKDYIERDGVDKGAKVKSIWDDKKFNNENGTEAVKFLFDGKKPFDFPKPVATIKECATFATRQNSIILDFFSGSATTAHAVMQLNAEDGGNRKFICVQLPEKCDEKSEAYKAGYANICEIGKERIRRAGSKILTELMQSNDEDKKKLAEHFDNGFRVLKLDSSNMKDVYYQSDEYSQSLLDSLDSNIKDDRSAEDLLFQVMLELGVPLSSKIEETTIAGKKVFNVAQGHLLACFDEKLTDDIITTIAKTKPVYFVMRDSSASNDSVHINFDQIFETYSPNTVRRVL